jgi:hypothetical protein
LRSAARAAAAAEATAVNGDQLKQAFRGFALKLTSLYLSK